MPVLSLRRDIENEADEAERGSVKNFV
jgi:hypothetical protein